MDRRQPKKRLRGALYRVSSGALIASVVYLLGVVLAYAAADGRLSHLDTVADWLLKDTAGAMDTAAAAVETLPGLLGQNLMSAGIVFLGGVVLVVPGLWLLFKNGLVLGAFLQQAVRAGISGKLLLAGLLPHGLLELLGLALIGGTGISAGIRLLLLGRKNRRNRLISLREDLGILLILSAGLLIASAIIEYYATPAILQWIKNLL